MAPRERSAVAVLAVLVVVLAVSASQAATAAASPHHRRAHQPQASEAGPAAASLLAGVDSRRAASGLRPLAPSGCATAFAARWAQHLAKGGRLQHQNLYPVMRICGVRHAGENVARGDAPVDVVGLWMGSAEHRDNILDSGYTSTGMATVQGPAGWVSVQVFLGR